LLHHQTHTKIVFCCSGVFFKSFIGQNKDKIFNKVKICQNRLTAKPSTKKEQKTNSFLTFFAFLNSCQYFICCFE